MVEFGSLLPAPEVNAAARVTFALAGEVEVPRESRGAASATAARKDAEMINWLKYMTKKKD